MRDLDYLKANNLARGGSMANAIVVGEDRILNDDGLRQNDEICETQSLGCTGRSVSRWSSNHRPLFGQSQWSRTEQQVADDSYFSIPPTMKSLPSIGWRIARYPCSQLLKLTFKLLIVQCL